MYRKKCAPIENSTLKTKFIVKLSNIGWGSEIRDPETYPGSKVKKSSGSAKLRRI
jgi:hypothetical protein